MKLRRLLIGGLRFGKRLTCIIIKYLLVFVVALYMAITILCFTLLTYEIFLEYGDFSYAETATVSTDLLVIYTVGTVNMIIIIIIYMLNKMYKKNRECLAYKTKYLRYKKRYIRLQTENEELKEQLAESKQ